jgi:hypothetical protein
MAEEKLDSTAPDTTPEPETQAAAVPDPITPAPAPAAEPPAWEQAIEVWFQDTRLSFPYLETEVHNQLFAAKEALKARLRGIIA